MQYFFLLFLMWNRSNRLVQQINFGIISMCCSRNHLFFVDIFLYNFLTNFIFLRFRFLFNFCIKINLLRKSKIPLINWYFYIKILITIDELIF
jgi:hypothetical protein